MQTIIKPWVSGIIDNLITVKLVLETNIEHKNRIALIILDNALEIAFKDYLSKVKKLKVKKEDLQHREQVHKIVKKQTKDIFDEDTWERVEFFYGLRCDFYHEEASKTITDTKIKEFYDVVEFIVDTLFSIESRNLLRSVDMLFDVEQSINNKRSFSINKVKEQINLIVVAVGEGSIASAKDVQDFLRQKGARIIPSVGVINKNFGNWYKHLFYLDSKNKRWTLSDEGQARYNEIIGDLK